MAAAAPGSPVGGEEFAGLMAVLGPFERMPVIAVAVSGGADSMALCLLADEWARQRAGSVTALIVDHGLRNGSDAEARRAAGWLAGRGIAANVLGWDGPKPTADIEAAAREARYRLMTGWCRDAGVLHLALAHHRDDQAETLLLRLARGSGIDGLAAMAAVVETPDLRLVRPLLGVPRARLRASLRARRQAWIEDPTNRDPAFARARLRALSPALAAEGLTAGRLAAAASDLGRARSATGAAVTGLLAAAAWAHPAGHCRVDGALYRAAPDEIARRALLRLLLCVGGGVYPPRSVRLERLHRALARDGLASGRTLGGCRIVPRRDGILICREPAAARDEVALGDGRGARWDGRFLVRAAPRRLAARRKFTVRRLGGEGWAEVTAARPELRGTPIPGAARRSLPAIFDLDGLVAVPHLRFVRADAAERDTPRFTAQFRPAQPLGPPGFAFAGASGYNAFDA